MERIDNKSIIFSPVVRFIAKIIFVIMICYLHQAIAFGTTSESLKFYVNENKDAGLNGTVNAEFQTDSTCNIYLPGSADTSKLQLSWSGKGYRLKTTEGRYYENGTAPIVEAGHSVVYSVVNNKEKIIQKIVFHTYCGSKSVPGLFINVDSSNGKATMDDVNESKDKIVSCAGNVSMGNMKAYMSLKGRGNSSWIRSKRKSYNIKLFSDEKQTKKYKLTWIENQEKKTNKYSLISNGIDRSLMRNKVCQELACAMGIGMPTQYVDLWVDGTYYGNYLLTPKTDYTAPSKGYMLELDNCKDPEDYQFKLKNMKIVNRLTVITVKDNSSETPVSEIESYMNEVWDSIRADDGYNKKTGKYYGDYIDLDSWAKLYLMLEYNKNFDMFGGSNFMYRHGNEPSEKLYAGPYWDADASLRYEWANPQISVPKQLSAAEWYIENLNTTKCDSWFKMLGKHADFRKKVREVYEANKSAFNDIPSEIDSLQRDLQDSAEMTYVKWPLNENIYANSNIGLLKKDTIYEKGTAYEQRYYKTNNWNDYIKNLREYTRVRSQFFADNMKNGIRHVPAYAKLKSSQLKYTGKTIRPSIYVYEWDGATVEKRNYKIAMPTDSTSVGKHVAKIEFQGTYHGTKALAYQIVPKGSKITKIKRSKKLRSKATIYWKSDKTKYKVIGKKTAHVSGYQIQYGTTKKFGKGTKSIQVKGYTKKSRKVTGLSKRRKYYFRVRTYVITGGKKYYSSWSPVKKAS